MKKVLFLLFAVICLVSCRTATIVDDSSELETIVPVVDKIDNEASVSDVVVPQMPELSNPSNGEPVLQQEAEVSITEPETQYNDSVDDLEEASGSVSLVVGDDVENVQPVSTEESVLENGEAGLSEEGLISEESVEDVSSVVDGVATNEALADSTPSNASQMPVKVSSETIEIIPSAAEASPSNDGSFLERLTAFVLREKLFSFGVFTVFVGLVMLIVVLIRDIARSSKPKAKAPWKTKDDPKPRHEELAMEDEDEFLRSLLNS